jgi:hypothetical protein
MKIDLIWKMLSVRSGLVPCLVFWFWYSPINYRPFCSGMLTNAKTPRSELSPLFRAGSNQSYLAPAVANWWKGASASTISPRLSNVLAFTV